MVFDGVNIRRGTSVQNIIHTRGLWGADTPELLTFFTSSEQTATTKAAYYEVWGSASLSCDDVRMFSVAYGHISGSGSVSDSADETDTVTKAIYDQYRLVCLDGESSFTLADSTKMNHFYVINVNRSKYGDKLDPGNFEVNLAELSGSAVLNLYHTGSNVRVSGSNPKIITLIDDSADTFETVEFTSRTSIARNLVSGSLTDGIYNPTNPHYYGKVYPSIGSILISAEKLDMSASFNTFSGSSVLGNNSLALFTSISGAASTKNLGFTARGVDVKNQSYYFIHVPNDAFNYSNNPTWVDDTLSLRPFLYKSWETEPVAYITTVGLYDNNKELLAVAKMNKPIKKSFNDELSITVKLEY